MPGTFLPESFGAGQPCWVLRHMWGPQTSPAFILGLPDLGKSPWGWTETASMPHLWAGLLYPICQHPFSSHQDYLIGLVMQKQCLGGTAAFPAG
jgi:hypothetical protein